MELSPRRRYAEEAAIVLATMGLAPASGKLLAWLLVCEPAAQSSTEMAAALGLSKGSVSTGIRLLESSGLVRRVAMPGRRGTFFEMTPDAMIQVSNSDRISQFRKLLEQGIGVVGGERAPSADRLRTTRDFYAFMEREIPLAIERFRTEQESKRVNHTREEGESDG
jgi:DNA-binding MarR family transcriptional regulator